MSTKARKTSGLPFVGGPPSPTSGSEMSDASGGGAFVLPQISPGLPLARKFPSYTETSSPLSASPSITPSTQIRKFPSFTADPDSASERLCVWLSKRPPAPAEKIMSQLEQFPEATREKDKEGGLPLHYACLCLSSEPLQIVDALLSIYPDAAREKNKFGDFALHMACRHQAPLAVVKALLLVFADAAREKNVAGNLPLHLALEKNAPLEVVQALLHVFPEGARVRESEGYLPLQTACYDRASPEVVQALIAAYPEAVEKSDEWGSMPLHAACASSAPLEVVEILIKAHPLAASVRGKSNLLPLHWACEKNAPIDVVQALLNEFPEAAAGRGTDQKLPLEWACESCAPQEVLEALLAAYPFAAEEKSAAGRLPCHIALEQVASPEFVEALLAAFPGAASVRDAAGWLPLHWAVENKASLRVVQALIAAHPDAARQKTQRGSLVLHVACEVGCPLQVVQSLLSVFPAAAGQTDMQGRLPLQLGIILDAPFELMQALLSACPEAVAEKDKNGRLPRELCKSFDTLLACILGDLPCTLQDPSNEEAGENELGVADRSHSFSWHWLLNVDIPKPLAEAHVFAVIEQVLLRHTSSVRRLAAVKDEQGREAINTVDQPTRQLLYSYMLFCGRYELQSPPAHKSETAVVYYALDKTSSFRVALKFMARSSEFEREKTVRANACFDYRLVVSIIRTHSANDDGETYKASAERMGLSAYPYCLVMPAADRSLKAIIDSEHIAGRDWPAVRTIAEQLVRCVGHVHERGIVHSDLKPLNIMRVGAHIKLIDLDAAVCYTSDPAQLAGSKSSSAFSPPELLYEDDISGSIKVRACIDNPHYDLVKAHPSQDMWGLGCVLFQLFSGEPLFISNDEDNLTEHEDLRRVLHWKENLGYKEHRMSHITDDFARYLVSQLLSADPHLRPSSAQTVLAHPFFSGKVVGRVVGQEALFDVFISYRVDSDEGTARALESKLSSRGLRVWWDQLLLKDGVSWEEGFCNGLVQSRCLVPILSKAAIKSRFEMLHEQSPCDNVLLEYRLAGELQARGMIERVFPVFMGEMDEATGQYGDYFRQECHPSPPSPASVAAVEAKLAVHLERQGLGLPIERTPSVKDILENIIKKQGGKVAGAGGLDSLLDTLASRVVSMVAEFSPSSTTCAAASACTDTHSAGDASAREVLESLQKLEREKDAAQQRVCVLEGERDEALRRVAELEAECRALRERTK